MSVSGLLFWLAAFATRAAAPPPTPAPAAAPIYVRAGQLWDGTNDAVREHMVITIDGDRVREVVPEVRAHIPASARVIDLTHSFVLPGLIDCHTHLAIRVDHQAEVFQFKDTPIQLGFAAARNGRKMLLAGFTSVRDLGSEPFIAIDLRNWIEDGYLIGPRVMASGPAISITGGHGDVNNFSPNVTQLTYPSERDFRIADGVDQVRHVVRSHLKYGADVIKINATGGVLSRGDSPGAPQYSVDELRAAVEEAHMAGRRIAAHAHGTLGIKNAILAGVDSIEHGSLLDDECIRLMKQHGTYLVADIYDDDFIIGDAVRLGIPREYIDKERKIGQAQRASFQRAVRAGVKVAFGTDAGVYPHEDAARQFAYMVKYGLSPAQALASATRWAADLLGRGDVGQLAPGRFADLIAVTRSPLADVRVLEQVDFVMKGGVVYKEAGRSLLKE
jgi:imidazolonepropionase-like amidohydrolase